MIELALATGIAPSVWAAEGEQSIVTAVHLLTKGQKRPAGGPQMSG